MYAANLIVSAAFRTTDATLDCTRLMAEPEDRVPSAPTTATTSEREDDRRDEHLDERETGGASRNPVCSFHLLSPGYCTMPVCVHTLGFEMSKSLPAGPPPVLARVNRRIRLRHVDLARAVKPNLVRDGFGAERNQGPPFAVEVRLP